MGTKIYFLCPNNNFYEWWSKNRYFTKVETLNKNGFDAFVLLQGKSKQKWFESNAPIAYSPYLLRTLKYIVENRKMTPRKQLTLGRWKRKVLP